MISQAEFLYGYVRNIVAQHTNSLHSPESGHPECTPNDVFIVWYCKTLQNHKALASSPMSGGMYYEVTYNGNRGEIYVDVYRKSDALRVQVEVRDDTSPIKEDSAIETPHGSTEEVQE